MQREPKEHGPIVKIAIALAVIGLAGLAVNQVWDGAVHGQLQSRSGPVLIAEVRHPFFYWLVWTLQLAIALVIVAGAIAVAIGTIDELRDMWRGRGRNRDHE